MIDYIVFFSILISPFLLMIKFKPQPQTLPYNPEMLKCESYIERRLYNGLTQHGLYPLAQYPEGKYRIDLAFPGLRIAIECDGKAYHSSPEQKAHDRKKNRYLRSKGWTVLRFSGTKINRDLPKVINKIKDTME